MITGPHQGCFKNSAMDINGFYNEFMISQEFE